MKKGFFHSVAALLLGSSLAVARSPDPDIPAARQEPTAVQSQAKDKTAAPAVKPAPKQLAAAQQAQKSPAPAAPLAPVHLPVVVAPGPVEPPAGGPVVCSPLVPLCACTEAVPERFWAQGEYLFWWLRGTHVPPLLTTGSAVTAGPQPTLSNSVLLFGNQGVDFEERSGGRFTAGYWLDDCQTWAVEGSYFFLADRSANFNINSNSVASGILARPFFNLSTGLPSFQLLAQPGTARGSASVELPSRLWGAEANVRRNVLCGCDYRVDLLAGFRYLDLREGLHVIEQIVSGVTAPAGAPLVFAGDTVAVTDRFDTRNQFYGGQLGADAEFRRGRWFVDVRGKVALGETHQVLDVAGNQVISGPAGVRVFPGGLLAEPGANIGHFTRDHFSVVPEFGLNVGHQVTNKLRAFVGYNFLFWSDVLRPADQVDLTVNPNLNPVFCRLNPAQCPTPITTPRPAVPFKTTDFWAQGINLGLEFRF